MRKFIIIIPVLFVVLEGVLLFFSYKANKTHETAIIKLKKENEGLSEATNSLKIICNKLTNMIEVQFPVLLKESEPHKKETEDFVENGENFFYVVIGSLKNEEDAQKHLQYAKERGIYDAEVWLAWNKNICYAILVGKYKSKQAAKDRRQRIIKDFPNIYSDAYVKEFSEVRLTTDELREKIQNIRIHY